MKPAAVIVGRLPAAASRSDEHLPVCVFLDADIVFNHTDTK
jgi:hypothetical protein